MIQQPDFDKPRRKLKPAQPPTAEQRRQQRRRALVLCRNAATPAALAIADKLAQNWLGCDCRQLLEETQHDRTNTEAPSRTTPGPTGHGANIQ